MSGRLREQLMALVCSRPGEKGKTYLSANDVPEVAKHDIEDRLQRLAAKNQLEVPTEPIEANPRSMDTQYFGFNTWGDLFGPRQSLCLLTFAAALQDAEARMVAQEYTSERITAILTLLAVWIDRIADKMSTLTRWDNTRENSQGTFGRQSLPMVWDFVEPNPFGEASGGADGALEWVTAVLAELAPIERPAEVSRGSATAVPWSKGFFDAVVTDPPYYDNVSYSNLSDFFYVWLKRTIGRFYPEHFGSIATPKKNEAIAAFYRHGGSKEKARDAYEGMMYKAFLEANRILKPDGQMVVVYAHKTTLGWATLVDSLRRSGFMVTEAWPLDTEMKSRLIAMETSSLASSIFLVSRKRSEQMSGRYEEVRPDLEQTVRERVSTLWELGVSGADLVIACVGAGLRAFTRFAKVEYANGEEVPAERFLTEVETAVLESILARLSREVGGNGGRYGLANVDSATRFYTLWRFTYKSAELESGEAIIFANGTHVELDGLGGLSSGSRPLVDKKRASTDSSTIRNAVMTQDWARRGRTAVPLR
jgi:putative DNA methylase